MTTLNYILTRIKNIAEQNGFIQEILVGEYPDKKYKYPLLWMGAGNVMIAESMIYEIPIFVCDRNSKGDTVVSLEILSDTAYILSQVIVQLRDDENLQNELIILRPDIQLEPKEHESNKDVNGYYATLRFECPNYLCLNNIPLKPNES